MRSIDYSTVQSVAAVVVIEQGNLKAFINDKCIFSVDLGSYLYKARLKVRLDYSHFHKVLDTDDEDIIREIATKVNRIALLCLILVKPLLDCGARVIMFIDGPEYPGKYRNRRIVGRTVPPLIAKIMRHRENGEHDMADKLQQRYSFFHIAIGNSMRWYIEKFQLNKDQIQIEVFQAPFEADPMAVAAAESVEFPEVTKTNPKYTEENTTFVMPKDFRFWDEDKQALFESRKAKNLETMNHLNKDAHKSSKTHPDCFVVSVEVVCTALGGNRIYPKGRDWVLASAAALADQCGFSLRLLIMVAGFIGNDFNAGTTGMGQQKALEALTYGLWRKDLGNPKLIELRERIEAGRIDALLDRSRVVAIMDNRKNCPLRNLSTTAYKKCKENAINADICLSCGPVLGTKMLPGEETKFLPGLHKVAPPPSHVYSDAQITDATGVDFANPGRYFPFANNVEMITRIAKFECYCDGNDFEGRAKTFFNVLKDDIDDSELSKLPVMSSGDPTADLENDNFAKQGQLASVTVHARERNEMNGKVNWSTNISIYSLAIDVFEQLMPLDAKSFYMIFEVITLDSINGKKTSSFPALVEVVRLERVKENTENKALNYRLNGLSHALDDADKTGSRPKSIRIILAEGRMCLLISELDPTVPIPKLPKNRVTGNAFQLVGKATALGEKSAAAADLLLNVEFDDGSTFKDMLQGGIQCKLTHKFDGTEYVSFNGAIKTVAQEYPRTVDRYDGDLERKSKQKLEKLLDRGIGTYWIREHIDIDHTKITRWSPIFGLNYNDGKGVGKSARPVKPHWLLKSAEPSGIWQGKKFWIEKHDHSVADARRVAEAHEYAKKNGRLPIDATKAVEMFNTCIDNSAAAPAMSWVTIRDTLIADEITEDFLDKVFLDKIYPQPKPTAGS